MAKQKTLMLKPCRVAFPKLTEPDNFQGQGAKKYSIRALIPKGDKAQHKEIFDFMKDAVAKSDLTVEEKKKALKTCCTDKDHDFYVLKDGDAKPDYLGHENHFYMNIKARGENKEGGLLPGPPVYYPKQPGEKVQLIPPAMVGTEIYGGVWVIIIIRAFVLAKPKPGVFLQISELMKYKDDEPFRKSAFDDADIDIPEAENNDDIEEF